jgi:AraC-like DNA-binding protein
VVVHLRSGRAHLSNEHHETDLGPDQLGLIPLDGRARLRFSRAEFELFSVPPAPLARLLGVPRVAVQLHAPRITPRSEALAEYVRQVAGLLTTSVFGTPEVYDFDLLRTHTIDTLTASIVEAFELTNRTEDAADRDAPVLRRAIKELGAHLADPVSIPEVAHAAGVSVRGLQLIFQRQLGVSPLLHLRTLRLHAARDALIDEATMGTTVADIARRFGYSNSGRFSTHYRNEFGEPPATSLQRVRSRPVDDASAASEANIVTQAASSPNDPGATGESSHG